jgi:predicted N-acyltransferase
MAVATMVACAVMGMLTPRAHSPARLKPSAVTASVGRPLTVYEATRYGVALSVISSIDQIQADQWDQCARTACAANGCGENPFVMHSFLHALEASRSVDAIEGWMPQHLVAHDVATGQLLAAVPLYLKSHSYGEYVFDHAWSRQYRAVVEHGTWSQKARSAAESSASEVSSSSRGGGGASGGAAAADVSEQPFRRQRPGKDVGYYPKLQAAVPFTPVTGPRFLIGTREPNRHDVLRRVLASGLMALSERLGVSSVHVTFATREESAALSKVGFLPRLGLQYHWHNDGYADFEDFLRSLKQSRRRAIRRERRRVAEAGIVIKRLRGAEITRAHWEAIYRFYCATAERRPGRAYLTREFFECLGAASGPGSLGDRVILVIAEDSSSGEVVAGALNLLGDDCMYGRHWGCLRRYDSLHFELCYYQAIEMAIELKLPRVEAGAQGEHKISRGYLPTLTYSSHYLRHPEFKRAVALTLRNEREQTYIALTRIAQEQNPFKADPAEHLQRQGLRVEGKRIVVETDKT